MVMELEPRVGAQRELEYIDLVSMVSHSEGHFATYKLVSPPADIGLPITLVARQRFRRRFPQLIQLMIPSQSRISCT